MRHSSGRPRSTFMRRHFGAGIPRPRYWQFRAETLLRIYRRIMCPVAHKRRPARSRKATSIDDPSFAGACGLPGPSPRWRSVPFTAPRSTRYKCRTSQGIRPVGKGGIRPGAPSDILVCVYPASPRLKPDLGCNGKPEAVGGAVKPEARVCPGRMGLGARSMPRSYLPCSSLSEQGILRATRAPEPPRSVTSPSPHSPYPGLCRDADGKPFPAIH